MGTIWINGIKQVNLSVLDRAVQFGDGCFTTAFILNGHIVLLEEHLKRLKKNCEQLLIHTLDFSLLESEMRNAALGQRKAVLKVIISTGNSLLGYSRVNCNAITRIILLLPRIQNYSTLRQQGVVLSTSPIRLSRNPLLAGVKHLNRLEQVLIRKYLDQKGANEALVLDTKGMVIECCAANLFWRKENEVYTPSLKYAGVDGIMRRYLMSKMAEVGLTCYVVNCYKKDIINADEVLICNSLMPILPVKKIDTTSFTIHSLYQQLYSIIYPLMEIL